MFCPLSIVTVPPERPCASAGVEPSGRSRLATSTSAATGRPCRETGSLAHGVICSPPLRHRCGHGSELGVCRFQAERKFLSRGGSRSTAPDLPAGIPVIGLELVVAVSNADFPATPEGIE